ncbi:MAG TPA: hypothetical protein VN030_13780, partial [Cellvibrio sp.]|nr:hypothetical protein [Cellvibrio sp.]
LSGLLKVPFALLAVLASILALYAAHHRSVEAQAAMKLTKSQNNFANYYKHIEEFEKYVDKVVKLNPRLFEGCAVHARQIYSVLFPENHLSVQPINFNVSKFLADSMSKVVTLFVKGSSSEQFPVNALIEMSELREMVHNLFKQSIRDEDHPEAGDIKHVPAGVAHTLNCEGRVRHFTGSSVVNLLIDIKKEFERYEILCRFDMRYDYEPFRLAIDKLYSWDRLWEYRADDKLAYKNICRDNR